MNSYFQRFASFRRKQQIRTVNQGPALLLAHAVSERNCPLLSYSSNSFCEHAVASYNMHFHPVRLQPRAYPAARLRESQRHLSVLFGHTESHESFAFMFTNLIVLRNRNRQASGFQCTTWNGTSTPPLYFCQRLLDSALALQPVVKNVEIHRRNAEKLASGGAVLPSPNHASLDPDVSPGIG